MGKQSSFTRQNAYDVLCTISSASQRNSTLEVDLRRTRKNISVLPSRLQEARFIIRILEDASSALLPPVPDLPAPPLPPRPDVAMAPPAARENPEHAHGSKEEEREPRPERGPSTPPPAPVQAPTVTTTPYEGTPLNKGTVYTPACPRAGTATNADRHHFPYSGTPTNKGTDNAPTLGRYYQKPHKRAHATDPLADQILANGSSTSRPTSVRADTDLQGDGRKSLAPAHTQGNIPLPHPDASVRHGWEQGRKITGERNATATARGRHPTGTKTTATPSLR